MKNWTSQTRKRKQPVSSWIATRSLAISAYYRDLYPKGRDLGRLRESFEQHGFLAAYPIVARPLDEVGEKFEIVAGVGRYTVAREFGYEKVPGIVLSLNDEEARRYAIEDNLYRPPTSDQISLVHAIVLARAHKFYGGRYCPERVWEFDKSSKATFYRASASLDHVLSDFLKIHPDLAERPTHEQVAEILRANLSLEFSRLFAGEHEINTFHKGTRKTAGKDITEGPSKVLSEVKNKEPLRREADVAAAPFVLDKVRTRIEDERRTDGYESGATLLPSNVGVARAEEGPERTAAPAGKKASQRRKGKKKGVIQVELFPTLPAE